jgi:cellulose synthase/poly-beta-1,6-N-acetylglucosamine synthase-like glycosyltransferase
MSFAEFAFVMGVALIGYAYVGYPLVLLCLPRRRDELLDRPAVAEAPVVSLIIACRNERARIAAKIENALASDYSPLQVIVASDCSDDGSDDIVKSYESRGVVLVRSANRRGKEHAQRLALEHAQGSVLVFSDAGTQLPPDAIQEIVSCFAVPTIGAVSSEDRFFSTDGSLVGEGAYVRYEMWLRRLESTRNSIVGLSGSFFAIRRQVAKDWHDDVPSDFARAMKAVELGYVAVSSPNVIGLYRDLARPGDEFSRKVRTAVRGMAAVSRYRQVLNPARYGVFAWQVISHKLMRWLVPWMMLVCLLSSAFAAGSSAILAGLLALQIVAYGVALTAHRWGALRSIAPVRIWYYFVQVNLALGVAAFRFARGDRVVSWNPSAR